MKQSPDRLMWGKGRIIHHENLYDLVESLKEKKPGDSLEAEKQSLRKPGRGRSNIMWMISDI